MKDDGAAQYKLAMLNAISDILHSVGCFGFRLSQPAVGWGYYSTDVVFTSEDSWARNRIEDATRALVDFGFRVNAPVKEKDDRYSILVIHTDDASRRLYPIIAEEHQ